MRDSGGEGLGVKDFQLQMVYSLFFFFFLPLIQSFQENNSTDNGVNNACDPETAE